MDPICRDTFLKLLSTWQNRNLENPGDSRPVDQNTGKAEETGLARWPRLRQLDGGPVRRCCPTPAPALDCVSLSIPTGFHTKELKLR